MNFISSTLSLLVSTLLLRLTISNIDAQMMIKKRNAISLSPILSAFDSPGSATQWFHMADRLDGYGNYPFNNKDNYQGYNSTKTWICYLPDTRDANLAAGGINGGYGGYGGNGGLRQYYGYWQPDYQGQRNRGYGYYTNSNYYGLPRPQYGRSGQYVDAIRSYRGYD
uniref:Uncharacterized protein n=1 Tax=Glossina brevipalpis TaxID=37001 RepID=A0A1A9X2X7_9MUSC